MSGAPRIIEREVPELRVVTETGVLDQAALEAWLPGAMARAVAAAEAVGGAVTAAELPFLRRDTADPVIVVVYEGNPNEGAAEVSVAVPVAAGGDRVLPPHREAVARVAKSLVLADGLGGVYDAVEAVAGEVGGAPREYYWTDFGAAGPDDEVFDVAWPMAAASG